MKLLKLVPDHTNLDFMRWRNLALVLSIIATAASIAFTAYRGLNLGSLVGVPYIRGLYKNGGEQLYMNRGIGITGLPIRFGARPEITLLELART